MAGKPYIHIDGLAALADRYLAGETVADVCAGTGINPGTLRRRFLALGIMRNGREGTQLAFANGRMAARKTRAGIPQSEVGKRRQSETMRRKADATARGWRVNTNGYVEFTRKDDPNCGRLEHVVIMEKHIGRRLRPGECVHHIDHDKRNNHLSNLALMTAAEHIRLHRRQEQLAGIARTRRTNGTFAKDY